MPTKKDEKSDIEKALDTTGKEVTLNGKPMEDKMFPKQNIYQKLSKFRESVQSIAKDGTNPHFKNKYATIESVLTTIDAPLQQSGLTFYQSIEGSNLITNIIDIDTGEKISSAMDLINKKGDMQGLGSAISYARRYSLVSMLGLIQSDDDGNNASASKSNSKAPIQSKLITLEQYQQIKTILDTKGLDENITAQQWNMKSIHELQAQNFSQFMEWVKAQ